MTFQFLKLVKWKSLARWILTLLIPFFLFVVWMNLRHIWVYSQEIHSSDPFQIPKTVVAIVPGAAVYGKTPSAILTDRLTCGLELYKKGRVQKILLSGDNGKLDYNELRPMLEFMLKNKVDPDDIFVDHAGFRTLDTLIRAKEVFLVKEAVFVSQSFFMARAMYLGKELDIKLFGYECNLRRYKKETYYQWREIFARMLAWWDIFSDTPPKYLGNPYPIEGSGVSTWKGSIPLEVK